MVIISQNRVGCQSLEKHFMHSNCLLEGSQVFAIKDIAELEIVYPCDRQRDSAQNIMKVTVNSWKLKHL